MGAASLNIPSARWLGLYLFGLAATIYFAYYVYWGLWTQVSVTMTANYSLDLGIYLDAARRAMAGTDPYQPFSVGRSFVYPPSALPVFVPLANTPDGPAHMLWASLSFLAYLVAIWVLWITFRPRGGALGLLGVFILAMFYAPMHETVSVGQVNCFVLLGLALFVAGYRDKRFTWLGDFGLAFAIIVKITPVLLLAFPFLHRDWRRCTRVVSGALVFVIGSVLAFGPGPWKSFFDVLPLLLQPLPFLINENIVPILAYYVNPDHNVGQAQIDAGKWFSAAVLGIWALIAALRNDDPRSAPAVLSFGIVAMTISSSQLWYHHLTFLLVPLFYLLIEAGLPRIWIPASAALFMLVQVNRMVERTQNVPPFPVAPPWPAVGAYLALFLILLVVVILVTKPNARPIWWFVPSLSTRLRKSVSPTHSQTLSKAVEPQPGAYIPYKGPESH